MSTDLSSLAIGAGPCKSAVPAHGGCKVADNLHVPNDSVTAIWPVDPRRPNAESLRPAGALLSRGGVIIYPTETSYGLGGNPKLALAVERIYRIKGREFSKPLPLIAANLEAVHVAVAEWPKPAEKLAQVFWPGPLTLILPAASHILPQIHGATGKIGIRISSHPVSQVLAAGAGGLLIATSANKAHQRAFQTPSEIPGEFLALVDALVDAGPSGEGCGNLSSTIVDACTSPPRLIRAGCVPWEMVLQVIGSFV
jgi:L-threonylcarbamoyladenylate synthase